MPSILAILSETFSNQFKWIYFKNPKTLCQYFIAFPESTLHFQHFEKKLDPHTISISEIIHSKKHGYLNV